MLKDWEIAAERPLPDILGIPRSREPENIENESSIRRRGRGHFQYNKDGLYSEQINESEEDFCRRENSDSNFCKRKLLQFLCFLFNGC